MPINRRAEQKWSENKRAALLSGDVPPPRVSADVCSLTTEE